MNKPTGLVTFLFTDIEGSTKLAQDFPEMLQCALDRHHSIMQNAIESNNGFVFKIAGDAFYCAFEKAEDAVKTAVDAQLNLANESWNDAVIKTRIGIHTGNAEWSGNGYMGYLTLARTARVMSAAYGEQILISNDAFRLLNDLKEFKTKSNQSGDLNSLSLREFKTISFRDLGERRLKDVIQPIRLFQILAKGLREDFPPLKTLDERPNNLPVQLTNFIGRENEIREVKNLLADSRLLTLVGAGGTGKTRLSIQASADLIDEFSNGVWIVELAPIRDPLLIPVVIARSVGINEQPNQEIEITLIDFFKEKELLMIFDNCEHLIKDCTLLIEIILHICPGIKIIATSREALRCEGETRYRVDSLAYPEPDETYTPLQLLQFEAVRLFIERAIAINSNFRIDNKNAPALVQICYQLDGIPLAIELAAARIKILSLEKICEKLDDRFKLLTGGKRTALPRQQTLRALIDWSYDLLSEKEKLLLQRLSVFSGGWSLEEAGKICSDEHIDESEITDILDNLLAKSLINSKENTESMRFYMLETIKQYSKEKLIEQPELNRRHFSYFKSLADHEQMKAEGIGQNEWIKLIEIDLNNIRAAIHWTSENEPDEACKLVNDLTEFWDIKGYFWEGLQTCQRILNSNLSISEIQKAKLLYSAGLMSHNIGNISDAERFSKESLAIFRKSKNKKGVALCLDMLGVISSINPARINEAKEYYSEALLILRELGMKKEIATTLYNFSFIAITEGNADLSLQYRLESLNIYREMKNKHEVARVLVSLCSLELIRKNFESARNYIEESLAISNQLGDKYLISINLTNLALIYSGQNENKKALEFFNRAIIIMKECGYKSSIVAVLVFIGDELLKLGDNDKAIVSYKESILLGSETCNEYFLARNLFGIGMSYYNKNDYENALRYFSIVKTLTDNQNDPIGAEKLAIAEEHKDKIRKLIGNQMFDKYLNEVLKLSKEEAVRFVLKEIDS